jgi:hypothetical protein
VLQRVISYVASMQGVHSQARQVREGLVPLIAAIKAKGAATVSDACVKGSFAMDKQAELCK